MKAKLLSFCLLAVVLLLGSCIFQKGKLAIEVADVNDDCPEKIADGITMTSVEMATWWYIPMRWTKRRLETFASTLATLRPQKRCSEIWWRNLIRTLRANFLPQVWA